jgi:hypothetical protein
MIAVSVSEIRTYLRCREEHRIAYVLGIRPRQADDLRLRVGSTIDAALGAWWSSRSMPATLAAVQDEGARQCLDGYELARCEAMMLGYDARWRDAQGRITTLAVQRTWQLEQPDRQPWALHGRIDAAMRAGDGSAMVVEHKTTSEDVSPGSHYWSRLTIDAQASMYLAAASAMGLDSNQCIYDVLRKPVCEPHRATAPERRKYRKDGGLYATQRETDEPIEDFRSRCIEEIAAAPERYYARVHVTRLERELQAALDGFRAVGREIVSAYGAHGPALRTTDACRRYGRTCDYFDVCTGAEDLASHRFRRKDQ